MPNDDFLRLVGGLGRHPIAKNYANRQIGIMEPTIFGMKKNYLKPPPTSSRSM